MHSLTVAQNYRPSMVRTIVKTATYKFLTFIAVVFLTYWRTGNVQTAFTIGGIDIFVKTIIYVAHERVWARIDAGKKA